MSGIELMNRVSLALLHGEPTGDERNAIMDAFAADVKTFEDLPADVQGIVVDLEDEADDDVARAAVHDGAEFERYWTLSPKGLKRWSLKAHPWRALVRLLRKHPEIHDAEGLASTYFKRVYGYWPGARKGADPVGNEPKKSRRR